jgi:hypothetical protein
MSCYDKYVFAVIEYIYIYYSQKRNQPKISEKIIRPTNLIVISKSSMRLANKIYKYIHIQYNKQYRILFINILHFYKPPIFSCVCLDSIYIYNCNRKEPVLKPVNL